MVLGGPKGKGPQEKIAPGLARLLDYYEANQEDYTIQPIVKAQHVFSTDREKLVEFKKQIE